MDVRLITVDELLTNEQGERATYLIPSYQRGYRWKRLQVVQLLDDIWEFITNSPQDGQFYCLQPIVLRTIENNSKFEIVDGQQRLITILIILNCSKLQVEALGKETYRIQFETRKSTEKYLNDIDLSNREDSIDNFHICDAQRAIQNWFEGRNPSCRMDFIQVLLGRVEKKSVRVIWFELPSSENPINAFTRLNVGKIPLSNDELIRALFLKIQSPKESHISDDQRNIAIEWDNYEANLRNDQFWYFLNNQEFERDNRIRLLFELIVNSELTDEIDRDPYTLFYRFHQQVQEAENSHNKLNNEWKKIRRVFMSLQEWYMDKRLYHIIGFLVHQGIKLREILDWSTGVKKSEFEKLLVREIIKNVFGDQLLKLDEEDWKKELSNQIIEIKYPKDREKIRLVLLLFNLVTIISNADPDARFPFNKFKEESWDIEHVRSVASEQPNRHKDQVDWLKHCLNIINGMTSNSQLTHRIIEFISLSSIDAATTNIFQGLYNEIREYFKETDRPEEEDHSIANLVLLDRGTNRAYKNAIFAVKRKHILEFDESGKFVPFCTRNVFLKSYSLTADQLMFWTAEDEEKYQQRIATELCGFIEQYR